MVMLSELASFFKISSLNQLVEVKGFCTDSRRIQAGDLFIALHGEQSNGHDYIPQAVAAGAVAVLADQDCTASVPVLRVADTHKALLELSRVWRNRFDLPIVAITGSCGKTSTRVLLQSILSLHGKTLASKKSYNNHIGVPLTLLELRETHNYAILEIGTNHVGEIAPLANLVKPNVAIITNAGESHLAGLGDVEGVAREKGAIFEALDENGIKIVNLDDAFAQYWHGVGRAKNLVNFGLNPLSDVCAIKIRFDEHGFSYFCLLTPVGEVNIRLQLLGKHNVYNALAAAAAALSLDVPLKIIKQGLETAQPESQRLVSRRGYADALIIDDSYNANPTSVVAAINVLTQHVDANTVLVLGDMLELGEQSPALHQKVGETAKNSGVKHLLGYGNESRKTVEAFGVGGQHFDDQAALLQALYPLLNSDVTVLIKGSKAMKMNQITDVLLNSRG